MEGVEENGEEEERKPTVGKVELIKKWMSGDNWLGRWRQRLEFSEIEEMD